MSFSSEVISKLIGSGKAQSGHFSGGLGAVSRLIVPNDMAVVVTKVTVNAFADLASGETFATLSQVVEKTWHQLNIWSPSGSSQVFQMRHKIKSIIDEGSTPWFLPMGDTEFEMWFNSNRDVYFMLSHVPSPVNNAQFTTERLPGNNPMPPIPGGYGIEPTGIPVLNHYQWKSTAQTFATPLPGIFTAPPYETGQMQWPINLESALNDPQPTIDYGMYTVPIVRIDYILINKQSNETFKPAVKQ